MTLIIYTDGSCLFNGQPNAIAGYGAYFPQRPEWNISRYLKTKPTNNRAELQAVYSALKRVYFHHDTPCTLQFYIDNQIAINTLMTTRKSGANWDIISKLYKARDLLIKRGYTIKCEWIKSHSNNSGNDKADKLAELGRYNSM